MTLSKKKNLRAEMMRLCERSETLRAQAHTDSDQRGAIIEKIAEIQRRLIDQRTKPAKK